MLFILLMFIKTTQLLQSDSPPPNELIPWLCHQHSLTDKLRTESGHAQLEVLGQHWTLPSWWDKFTLGLPIEAVLHRNILMFSQQTPCWFARTIVPEHSYRENRQFFNRLAQESLGVIIFNEPKIKRTQLLNYQINENCIEYHWLPSSLINKNKQVWVRLSTFTIAELSSFYLVEILLPGLLRVLK
jgi:chorismate--pyruvate lyase